MKFVTAAPAILQFFQFNALLGKCSFQSFNDFFWRAAAKRVIPELPFLRRDGFLQTLSLFLQRIFSAATSTVSEYAIRTSYSAVERCASVSCLKTSAAEQFAVR